jgi:predicted HTH domain antitoxin
MLEYDRTLPGRAAMTVKVTLEFPEEVLATLKKSPEGFAQELRLTAAVKWYDMGVVSQSRAAEIAGMSREEFLLALQRFGVSPFQVDAEELGEAGTNG